MTRAASLVLSLLIIACVAPSSFGQSSQSNQSNQAGLSGQAGSSSFTQIQDMNKADSVYARANSAMSSGDVEGALILYQKAILEEPQSADLHNDYGTALALKGNWEEASAEYKTATTLKPKDELFHANYARTLMKLGRRADAQSELKLAYKINPKNKNVISALADVCVKQSDLPQASLILKEGLQIYPDSADLNNRLSYVLAQESQQPGDEWLLDLALKHANDAVKDDQKSIQALLNLGSVQILKHDAPSAVETYRKAVQLAPANAETYYLMSSALEKNGDKVESVSALRKFLELGAPSDPRVKEAHDKLSSSSP
jgi:Flp pilus assembly protein TadD